MAAGAAGSAAQEGAEGAPAAAAWTRAQLQALWSGLLAFGYGRPEALKEKVAALGCRSADEIADACDYTLTIALQHVRPAGSGGGGATAAAGGGGGSGGGTADDPSADDPFEDGAHKEEVDEAVSNPNPTLP